MKPQIRTYILAVGRDKDDRPFRKLARYKGRPLAGLNDNYEQMNAAELRSIESHLHDEQEKIAEALADIQAEKFDRLRSLGAPNHVLKELMSE